MGETYVLGLSYSIHDCSACLMRDGEIVAAINKERLSRIKRDGGRLPAYPRLQRFDPTLGSPWDLSIAIDYCLAAADITLDRVDLIVENHLLNVGFEAFHGEVNTFVRPYPIEKSVMISHHLAHAYSTYYASGFEDALVIVVDGEGNSLEAIRGYQGEDAEYCKKPSAIPAQVNPITTEKISIYSAERGVFRPLRKDFTPGSLGGAYAYVSRFIFDDPFEGGKVMGLAPYGKPGAFPYDFIESREGVVNYPYLINILNFDLPAPAHKWPENHDEWSADLRLFADMSWKVQHDVELALLDIARDAQKRTGYKKLCIAGGVGLNSVANKKIRDELRFEDVYIMPPAGDDGISIGCAYWGTHRARGVTKRTPLRSAAVGRTYSEAEVEKALSSDLRLRFTKMSEDALLDRTIDAMMQGKILGWYQGGSEIGPRALGHRSIIADARHPDMKAILNRRVKFREAFRPFAPAVTLERVGDYFEMDHASPYMLMIAPVRQDKRALLPSITHVDGTGRVQTLTEAENGRFYRLAKMFGERTGVPVIVNTSFNIKGEPIVETPADAVECFSCNDVDYLVIEDFWVEKVDLDDQMLLAAVPSLNPRVILRADRRSVGGALKVVNATVFFKENVEYEINVRPHYIELLSSIDGKKSVSELASELARRTRVEDEVARPLVLRAVRDGLHKNFLRLAAS